MAAMDQQRFDKLRKVIKEAFGYFDKGNPPNDAVFQEEVDQIDAAEFRLTIAPARFFSHEHCKI